MVAHAQLTIGQQGITCRTRTTRHGPGPFVTEDPALVAAIPDAHNATNPWQRAFRVGHFDLVATRYALEVSGPVDGLAVTNLDRLAALPTWPVCHAYRYAGAASDLDGFFEHAGRTVRAIPVRRPPDLDHQEALTARLRRCAPRYAFRPGRGASGRSDRVTAYCAFLDEQLGAPVVLSSHGPTAADKTPLQPWPDDPSLPRRIGSISVAHLNSCSSSGPTSALGSVD
jgi:adenylosuccinate synthase